MAVLSLDASHAAGESRYKRVISSHFPCKEVASLDMIVRHVPLLRSLWLLKHCTLVRCLQLISSKVLQTGTENK